MLNKLIVIKLNVKVQFCPSESLNDDSDKDYLSVLLACCSKENSVAASQPAFSCSKSIIETSKQSMKSVQS